MRLYPNYQQPIVEALAVLEDSGISRFPVDLHAIQRQYKNLFEIRSFGNLMKDKGISREDCCHFFGSTDGAAVCNGFGRYIVFYNEEKIKQRIRFTIAHELGHIFLNHHEEYGKSVLERGGVTPTLYERIEHEADCFARNLLCPAYNAEQLLISHGFTRSFNSKNRWIKTGTTQITKNLKSNIGAEALLVRAFDISLAAAKARVDFLAADRKNLSPDQLDASPTLQLKHTAMWYCPSCGLARRPGASYCSECGRKSFVFLANRATFHYRDIGINDFSQFISCPVCGNRDFSKDAGFCKICGTPLSNTCTQDVAHINHPEAKYCNVCGKPTSFKDTTHHIKVKESLITINEGDFRMIYESDIEYDPDTFKVKECPRCHNEIFSENADYCRICGLELINVCIPEPVEWPNGDYGRPDPHENPPDARYCEQCGALTVYYGKHELLRSYEDVMNDMEGNDEEEGVIPF